jgi:hypothetical protein
MRVYVAGDIHVDHDFSLMDMANRVTLSRYRNIRLAESAFWDLEMGFLGGIERTVSLVRQALKHLFLHDTPELRFITYEFLKRRLFWSKKRRLAAWKSDMLERFPQLETCGVPAFGDEKGRS